MLKANKGFTLIELLIVIAIIGVLSTLSVAAFGYARDKAAITKAEADVATLSRVIANLAYDTNLWPGGQPTNIVCTDIPGGCPAGNEICGGGDCASELASSSSGIVANDGTFSNWEGPYMPSLPLDSWGNQYFFDTDYQVDANDNPCNGCGSPIDAVVVGSFGPDGTGNNLYNGDDIIKVIFK